MSDEAKKFDQNKDPLSLIPRDALIAVSRVLAYGARKYDPQNWRKGMNWSRLIDATLRHLTAWNEGVEVDSESGLSHLAHAMCNIAFLITYQARGLGKDDRYKEPTEVFDALRAKYDEKDR